MPNPPPIVMPDVDRSEANAGGKTIDLQTGAVEQGYPGGVTVEAPELLRELAEDVKRRQ